MCSSDLRDLRHGEFSVEMLILAEIDTDERIAAQIAFGVDDVDAAFAELDARYLAGEAAPCSEVWSAVMEGIAALHRHELPRMTPDVAWVDHRRGLRFALPPGDLPAYLVASWELMPQASLYVAAVHRLSNLGAVFTQVMKGASREGFDAEWREIGVLTVEGDLISRAELFDEADLDVALAKFDELDRPASP